MVKNVVQNVLKELSRLFPFLLHLLTLLLLLLCNSVCYSSLGVGHNWDYFQSLPIHSRSSSIHLLPSECVLLVNEGTRSILQSSNAVDHRCHQQHVLRSSLSVSLSVFLGQIYKKSISTALHVE